MSEKRKGVSLSGPNRDPDFRAPSLWNDDARGNGEHPLSAEDRALLAAVSTVVRYKKGEIIFREGARADGVFNIISGVVESVKRAQKKKHVVAFLWPGDLLGLAQNGKYVNTSVALTPVAMFKVTPAALEPKLRRNPSLDFQLICKLCHELREAQQHAFLLGQHRAVDRLTMFLQLLESQQEKELTLSGEIYLPMSRVDIAAYLGVSAEAVARALRTLEKQGAIRTRKSRHIKILDRQKLEASVVGA